MDKKVRVIIDRVKHPESQKPIHDGGYVEEVNASADKITVVLRFEKSHDPFAIKIKKRVESELQAARQELGLKPEATILVMIKEGVAKKVVEPQLKDNSTTRGAKKIIAIASGKGGVGKSSVTANLAMALTARGFSVGVLDADIYGPSQPRMFGVEEFLPEAIVEGGREYIIPAEAHGVKVMSIGFFIAATDPLLWRGSMASNALKQLLHQTKWGELDFLLVDLPPGTGDIHLTILSEIKFSEAIIVSTPQGVALADVVRGVEMFAHKNVMVPIKGIIENMSYFTPDDIPDKKYYIFGKGGASRYAVERGIELLGEIPIYQSVMSGAEEGTPATCTDERVAKYYLDIASRL
ncbi:MAG: Mrp/NBP35 family ATP-binding protein [Rikenellaceae bacterium]